MRGETRYSKRTVTPEQLAAAIQTICSEYGEEVTEAVIIAGRKATRETAKDVNASASSKIHGRRGKYEGSWKSKFTAQRLGFEGVVYSTQPGLAHLLEKGHRITYLAGNKSKGPGHARAIPHIAEVDERLPEKLETEIERQLSKL